MISSAHVVTHASYSLTVHGENDTYVITHTPKWSHTIGAI